MSSNTRSGGLDKMSDHDLLIIIAERVTVLKEEAYPELKKEVVYVKNVTHNNQKEIVATKRKLTEHLDIITAAAESKREVRRGILFAIIAGVGSVIGVTFTFLASLGV